MLARCKDFVIFKKFTDARIYNMLQGFAADRRLNFKLTLRFVALDYANFSFVA